MKKTVVINLYGGPGAGKSTLAAELYYKMKKSGHSVELVREYVKDWAWENRKVEQYDQIYITGKQAKRETSLYSKVDYIITDSPLLLSPFYGEHYSGIDYILPSVLGLMDHASENGVSYRHYLLKRNKQYVSEGRYETEAQAKGIDWDMTEFLEKHEVPFLYLDVEDTEKADWILSHLKAAGDLE